MSEKTQIIESVEYEITNSDNAEVLAEIPVEYDNDEEITKPDSALETKIFICRLNKTETVFRSLGRNSGKISGDLVVETQNLPFIAESIKKFLNEEKPWNESFELKNGKDDLLIQFTSSWAGNLPAPLERISINNRRRYLLDNLRAHLLGLNLPLRTAEKTAQEIENLKI